MKRFFFALGLLSCLCILLSSCKCFKTGPESVPGKTPGLNVSQAPLQTFVNKEGRTYAPNQPVPCVGLAGSELKITVHAAETHENIDAALFSAQRFSHESKEYMGESSIIPPYAFVTVEMSIKAVKGSDIFKDGYYIDVLRLVDLNKTQNFKNVGYYNTMGEGDIKLSDTQKDYNLFHLEEGKSGRILAGFFINKESIASEELSLSVGPSKDDCFYVPLHDLL